MYQPNVSLFTLAAGVTVNDDPTVIKHFLGNRANIIGGLSLDPVYHPYFNTTDGTALMNLSAPNAINPSRLNNTWMLYGYHDQSRSDAVDKPGPLASVNQYEIDGEKLILATGERNAANIALTGYGSTMRTGPTSRDVTGAGSVGYGDPALMLSGTTLTLKNMTFTLMESAQLYLGVAAGTTYQHVALNAGMVTVDSNGYYTGLVTESLPSLPFSHGRLKLENAILRVTNQSLINLNGWSDSGNNTGNGSKLMADNSLILIDAGRRWTDSAGNLIAGIEFGGDGKIQGSGRHPSGNTPGDGAGTDPDKDGYNVIHLSNSSTLRVYADVYAQTGKTRDPNRFGDVTATDLMIRAIGNSNIELFSGVNLPKTFVGTPAASPLLTPGANDHSRLVLGKPAQPVTQDSDDTDAHIEYQAYADFVHTNPPENSGIKPYDFSPYKVGGLRYENMDFHFQNLVIYEGASLVGYGKVSNLDGGPVSGLSGGGLAFGKYSILMPAVMEFENGAMVDLLDPIDPQSYTIYSQLSDMHPGSGSGLGLGMRRIGINDDPNVPFGPASLTIVGNVAMQAGSTLRIAVSDSQNSLLDVIGSLSFASSSARPDGVSLEAAKVEIFVPFYLESLIPSNINELLDRQVIAKATGGIYADETWASENLVLPPDNLIVPYSMTGLSMVIEGNDLILLGIPPPPPPDDPVVPVIPPGSGSGGGFPANLRDDMPDTHGAFIDWTLMDVKKLHYRDLDNQKTRFMVHWLDKEAGQAQNAALTAASAAIREIAAKAAENAAENAARVAGNAAGSAAWDDAINRGLDPHAAYNNAYDEAYQAMYNLTYTSAYNSAYTEAFNNNSELYLETYARALHEGVSEAYAHINPISVTFGRQQAVVVHDQINRAVLDKLSAQRPNAGISALSVLYGEDDLEGEEGASREDYFNCNNKYWARAIGARSEMDASLYTYGFKGSLYGAILGVEECLSGLTRGAALSYARSEMKRGKGDVQNYKGTVDSFGLTLYGSYTNAHFFADGLFNYSYNKVQGNRTIDIYDGSYNLVDRLSNRHKIHDLAAAARFGGMYYLQEYRLMPTVGLEYIWSHRGSSVDRWSDGTTAFAFGRDSSNRFVTPLAISVSRDFLLGDRWLISPEIRAGWAHLWTDDMDTVNVGYSGVSGHRSINGIATGRSVYTAGVGLNARYSDRMNLVAAYDYQEQRAFRVHNFNGGLDVLF